MNAHTEHREPRQRARSALATLSLAAVLTASLIGLSAPPASFGRDLGCARAQLRAGTLRCDRELVADLGDVCAGEVSAPVAAGDAIELGACACARVPALRGYGLECPAIRRMAPADLAALDQRVEINTASVDELASLPGIGPALAGRIVAGRPHASVDALVEVRGIGPKRLEALARRAYVGARDPTTL